MMSSFTPDRDRLYQYEPLLRVWAVQLHTDPRLQRRFEEKDIVQEALCRAVARLEDCQAATEAAFVSWLHAILHSTFVDMVRHAQADCRNPEMEIPLAAMAAESSARLERMLADDQETPSEVLSRREQLLLLAQAVDQLPEKQRWVVVLKDLHELAVRDIAERLGRTEKTIAGLLFRGREGLRRILNSQS
jgi:RNA polymerase sigma-70 factor (ECF subfamily)